MRFLEGTIRYLDSPPGKVAIHYIEIHKDFRNIGIWSNFLKRLMDTPSVNKIVVCATSNYQIEYATSKNYIGNNYCINQGGDLVWEKDINNKSGYTGVLIDPERVLRYKICMIKEQNSI